MPDATVVPDVKSVGITIHVWYQEKDGEIHIVAHDLGGFHTSVREDPSSKRGHPNLYAKLRKVLQKHGRWPDGHQAEHVESND